MFAKLKRAAEGAHVPHFKATNGMVTVKMPLPSKIVLPMQQHIGAPCEAVVKKGDSVCVGTLVGKAGGFVSANIYSGVSGTVTEITTVNFAAGGIVPAVVIVPDGEQRADAAIAPPPPPTDQASLVEVAQACGLVGLGGAGFPTAVKFSPKDLASLNTLIINGAECEPYITTDNREFLECTDTILEGIAAVKKCLGLQKVIIGIERNKEKAIDLMVQRIKGLDGYTVCPMKTVYPQGAEKVLIEQTTGKEVPRGKLPADVGVLVLNIATVSTLGKFLRTGMPLVSKRLTVDGNAVHTSQNVEVLIGTPVIEVLDFCGGLKEGAAKVLTGGPMMGTAMLSLDFPIVKQNNALLAFDEKSANLPKPGPCIRCGRCSNACPMGLSPVEIAGGFTKGNVEVLNDLMVDLCIGCGTCTFVCPAKRPVTQTMNLAKIMQKEGGKK